MSNTPARVQVTEVGTRDGFQAEPKFIPHRDQGPDHQRPRGGRGPAPRVLVVHVAARGPAARRLGGGAEGSGPQRDDDGSHRQCQGGTARGRRRRGRAGRGDLGLREPQPEERQPQRRRVPRRLRARSRSSRPTPTCRSTARFATAFGCPFEGDVPFEQIGYIAERFEKLGFHGIGLGDTTGMATPAPRHRALPVPHPATAFPEMPRSPSTSTTRAASGSATSWPGLDEGIDRFESSIGGLGGCPFAPGATGNICTEDLVYLLHEMGIETGIDLDRLCEVARYVEGGGGTPPSRAGHEGGHPRAPACPRRGPAPRPAERLVTPPARTARAAARRPVPAAAPRWRAGAKRSRWRA